MSETYSLDAAVALPLLIALGFAVVWIGRRGALRRLQQIAALRRGEGSPGRGVFLAYLTESGLPPEDAHKVYQYFQKWLSDAAEEFPVELDDQLGRVLGICGLDVDEAAEDVAELCHCKLPQRVALSHDQTVRDFLNIVLSERRAGRRWWLGDGEAR
jgi:hypothetical protein